jgi:hypothetical protein
VHGVEVIGSVFTAVEITNTKDILHRLSQMLLDLKISALVCAAIDSKNGSLVLMQTVFFL